MFYRVIILFVSVSLLWTSCSELNQGKSPELKNSITDDINFANDIAPIIHEHCSHCHRPGQAGPFSLLGLEDLRKKAKTIREVINKRYMPPWPADPKYQNYVGENFLSDEEISMINHWIKLDMPTGNLDSLQIPKFSGESFFGEPDFSASMVKPVKLPGNNEDQFRLVKIPIELPHDTFVETIEFVPGNRQLVHHMNGHIVNYETNKKQSLHSGFYAVDPEEENALRAYIEMDIPNDDGSFPTLVTSICNYLPGVLPLRYPDGIGGFKLAQSSLFLMQTIHYGPSARDTFDLSGINLFFMDEPPKRPLREKQLGSLGLGSITPEFILYPDSIQNFTIEWQCDEDISLLTIIPHMHLLGTDYLAYAIIPSGDTIPLIKIDKWDFRWQYFYTLKKMTKISKGSRILAHASFDNTVENPNQPFEKPRKIIEPIGDMKTTDEMFQFIFTYLPYEEGDEYISLEVED